MLCHLHINQIRIQILIFGAVNILVLFLFLHFVCNYFTFMHRICSPEFPLLTCPVLPMPRLGEKSDIRNTFVLIGEDILVIVFSCLKITGRRTSHGGNPDCVCKDKCIQWHFQIFMITLSTYCQDNTDLQTYHKFQWKGGKVHFVIVYVQYFQYMHFSACFRKFLTWPLQKTTKKKNMRLSMSLLFYELVLLWRGHYQIKGLGQIRLSCVLNSIIFCHTLSHPASVINPEVQKDMMVRQPLIFRMGLFICVVMNDSVLPNTLSKQGLGR